MRKKFKLINADRRGRIGTIAFVCMFVLAMASTSSAQQRLVVVGGGKRPPEAMKRFVEWAGGSSANILVVPWATSEPEASFEYLRKDMAELGPRSIVLAPVVPLTEEKKSAFLTQLKEASGVFFTGGDQVKTMTVLKDESLASALRDRYESGVVFGGTSAGAAIMSTQMITGEGDFTVIDGGKVQTIVGLGLLPDDAVLSFENGGNNIATVARRGYSDWRLEVTAKTGHSSAIFKESMGSGAIFEAARILNEFYTTLKDEKYLTFNPSIISGGTELTIGENGSISATGKGNVVPARLIVSGDLRFISEEQKAAARAKMSEIVARSLPGTSSKITFEDGFPAMSPKASNYELLKELDKVSQDLGMGRINPLDPGERGAGDISFIADMLPALDGLGATGGGSHAKGEYVDLTTLPQQTKRAALLIYRLTR